MIAVNLTASFAVGQRAARAMVETGRGGVILFTASISSLGGSPEFSHYNAAKAGIANLVKTMSLELVKHGIRVNCVSPGPSDTQQSVDLVGEELMEKWRREGFPVVPMGRLGKPEDMAAAFSFLASDDAAYITGVNLVVDGGLTAHAYSVPEWMKLTDDVYLVGGGDYGFNLTHRLDCHTYLIDGGDELALDRRRVRPRNRRDPRRHSRGRLRSGADHEDRHHALPRRSRRRRGAR